MISKKDISTILKYIITLGIGALLFIPFIKSDGLFFPFITGKAYFFRITTEIIFFLWLILAIVDKNFRPKRSLLSCSIVIFLLSILISNIFGVNWTASFWSNFERMEGYITLIHLLALFFVTASILKTKLEWQILFYTTLVLNLWMNIDLAGGILDAKELGNKVGRIDGPLGNPIYLAVYSLFHIFIALYCLVQIKIKKYWYLGIPFLISIILNIYILFMTGTRGAMLGMVGGFLLVTILAAIFVKENKIIKYSAAGGLLAILIAISLFIPFRNSEFIQSVGPLKRLATISLTEGTSEARILNWKIAWEGVKERPLFGWGQSNYNYVFDKHYLPAMHGNETWFDRVHNVIFDWLIAGGFVGLTLYLGIFVASLWLLWFSRKRIEDQHQQLTKNSNKNHNQPDFIFSRLEASVLTGLLGAYFIHNFFVFDHTVSYLFFFLILAYIYSQTSKELKFFQKDIKYNFSLSLIILSLISVPVFAIGLNYNSYNANKELIKASLSLQSTGNVSVQNIQTALDLYKDAISRGTFGNPEIVQRFIMIAPDVYQALNNSKHKELGTEFLVTAIFELQKLIENDPQNSRYPYLLGVTYAKTGQVDLSIENLKKAIDLSPNKQTIRNALITIYRSVKDEKGNLVFLEQAYNLAKETYELDKSKDDLWIQYAKITSVYNDDLFKELIEQAKEEAIIKTPEEGILEVSETDIENAKNQDTEIDDTELIASDEEVRYNETKLQKVVDLLSEGIKNATSTGNPQPFISLSSFYYQIGNATRAIEILDQAIVDFPKYKSQIENIKKNLNK